MTKNPLLQLRDYGQSVWYDNISRDILQTGELERLIKEDGVVGVTSNPTIFQKAMAAGSRYDEDLSRLAGEGKRVEDIYEELATTDIATGADTLRRVYDETNGLDGYISLEVSPLLAHDTAGTVAEAKRLFSRLNRPNVMIKVPATPEGIPAIAELIGAGININVTLIFALSAYEAVAGAYIEGLQKLAANGGDLSKTASVASFFVSRVDTLVDKQLAGKPQEMDLRGKAAIANAKLAYARFQKIFAGSHWEALQAKGAHVQRPLWASTSTKNPAYRDIMYAEELIGPHTVDTMPPQTVEAFRDHGQVAETVTRDVAGAERVMGELAQAGIAMSAVTQQLLDDGVKAFADSFGELMAGLGKKVESLVAR